MIKILFLAGLGSLFFVSCKSYSLHEDNLTQQAKTMLKHDRKSKQVQQKMRSEKQVKKKLVKRPQNKYIS